MVKDFMELKVWKDAADIAVLIYKIADTFPKDFRMYSQITSSATSISANISEGFNRSDKEFARYLDIASGSVNETITFVYICYKIRYVNENDYLLLTNNLREISREINGLIKYLNNKS